MGEARDRRLQQFSSSIFGESQPRAVTPQPTRSTRTDYSPLPARQESACSPVPESNSFRSTVFKPPEAPAPRYNPHRPNDHYAGDFYEVAPSRSVQRPPQPEFKPKYKYEQRATTPNAPVRREKAAEPVERSARERKGEQMTSHILATKQQKYDANPGLDEAMYKASFKWTDARSEMTKRDQRQIAPEERRRLEGASSVFGAGPLPPPNSDPSPPVRPTDRNYSDLFGREFSQPRSHPKETLTPSSASWKDAHYEAKAQPVDSDYSPSRFRDQQLRSTFDRPVSPTPEPAEDLSSKPVSLQPQDLKRFNLNQADIGVLPRPEEAQLDTFVIKGLGPRDDVQTVRQLCQGLHIVSIETENDDIKGTCEGQAKVVLRHFPGSEATERLRKNVAANGLGLSQFTQDIKRKSNYTELANRSFLDHQVELEARKPDNEALTPHMSKMRLLESSADVYGSSPGVGRWPASWKDNPASVPSDKTAFSQAQQWDGVRKAKSPAPQAGKALVRPDSGFLQSTEAARNRWRG